MQGCRHASLTGTLLSPIHQRNLSRVALKIQLDGQGANESQHLIVVYPKEPSLDSKKEIPVEDDVSVPEETDVPSKIQHEDTLYIKVEEKVGLFQEKELLTAPSQRTSHCSPMLSDAVCLKVEDHQLVHASYDEAQDANENIRVSDVGLQHHNSAIKAEAHEDKFYYSNIDEQFYGSKVDIVYSMSELMPSLSQHASDLVDYDIDVIHIQTQTEGDTSKDQFSCVFNYKEVETDTAEEIVDSLISLGMPDSVLVSSVMIVMMCYLCNNDSSTP